jgi:restriction system protein
MELPWPVGVILAALCYFGAHVYASQAGDSGVGQALGTSVLMVSPWFAGLFLIASLISFIKDVQKKRLFQQNQSIDKIRRLNWRQFEQFIGQHFKAQGYSVVETPAGPDGGIDLVLRKHGEKTYVQCKHWKASTVGVPKIRELLGAMTSGGATNGAFVTTGRFSEPARKFAEQHAIQLLDGSALKAAYDFQAPPPAREVESKTESALNCPVCNSSMVLRTAKRGKNAGSQFWGCPKYPACRGTRPA